MSVYHLGVKSDRNPKYEYTYAGYDGREVMVVKDFDLKLAKPLIELALTLDGDKIGAHKTLVLEDVEYDLLQHGKQLLQTVENVL